MQRPRIAIGVLFLFFMIAGSSVPVGDLANGPVRADDAPSLPQGQPAAATPAKPAASSQKPKKNDIQIRQRRAQRAQARRAAVALDDEFGPGAASQAGWVLNANGQGTTALTGSQGPGSSWGAGNYIGAGTALGSGMVTGTGPSNGSSAGTTSGTTGTAGQSGTGSTDTPDLNAKVLEFAVKNIGKQVGNGQCWTLGAEALAYAGGEPPHGYVFGDAIPLSQALPGDILQFYKAHFAGLGYWMILGAPNHTAILQSVDGTTITMLNQNVNYDLRVQTSVINMADFVSGSLTVYRPIAPTSR
jgi:hypothetical protein